MLRTKNSQIILLSLALHLALILYADHVDSHPERYGGLRYTDVDWRVVTDGARLIFIPTEKEQAKGWLVKKIGLSIGDPYDRATFRYTPLLPLFLSPALIHPLLGKCLLALPSLLIPLLLLTGPDPAPFWPTHLLWTINPFVLSITTRGSPEAAICFLVVTLHYFLRLGSRNEKKGAGETRAAIVLALAVSWKIYPAIYIPAIWKELSARWGWFGMRVWRFGLIVASSFVLINGALWSMWVHFCELTHYCRGIPLIMKVDGDSPSLTIPISTTCPDSITDTTFRHTFIPSTYPSSRHQPPRLYLLRSLPSSDIL
ncbi:conserved hypothetical protein [Cryptococcus deneoformans JEC21]|uniref:GPI mannosyltransferase 1 n=1 Tax=Cryptococcus deneoformans (strain JEC21 / ATCC MYA-565) TaxID=214684 RepID=Q5KM02_CRYD1|nr:conserved hypothetical protein [Cryptococcus neoformans var. neoformans JEC21]AAW41612.1 conserved hypothetical protein [Cryptococcus neoformans var. neoformans JEC21]